MVMTTVMVQLMMAPVIRRRQHHPVQTDAPHTDHYPDQDMTQNLLPHLNNLGSHTKYYVIFLYLYPLDPS